MSSGFESVRFLAAALMAACLPAMAETPPALWPARDVVVTYDMQSGNGTMIMSYDAETRRVRAESPEFPDRIVIMDIAGSRMLLISTAARKFAALPLPPDIWPNLGTVDVTYTRGGTRTIAGQECTDWAMRRPQSTDAESVCLTAEGVPLRVQQDILAEATRIREGALDPKLLVVPEGFAEASSAAELGLR